MFVVLAGAACTGSGPSHEAQTAIAKAIDCASLPAPVEMQAELALAAGRAAAPLDAPLRVRLQDLRAVSPAVTPGRKEKSAERFAGLVPFVIDTGGAYAVLVASMAWADVGEAAARAPLEPRGFHWITVCGKKYKSGLYTLETGKRYFVQLWDSPDASWSS